MLHKKCNILRQKGKIAIVRVPVCFQYTFIDITYMHIKYISYEYICHTSPLPTFLVGTYISLNEKRLFQNTIILKFYKDLKKKSPIIKLKYSRLLLFRRFDRLSQMQLLSLRYSPLLIFYMIQ